MKKLSEYEDLLTEEVDEKLLKEALEKSKHNCTNCKYQSSRVISSSEYYTNWEYRCTNREQIYQLNDMLKSVEYKFPNLVSTYNDTKIITDRYRLCRFFEPKEWLNGLNKRDTSETSNVR